eukprot:5981818-Alexandrium_andersonii.AAC.1
MSASLVGSEMCIRDSSWDSWPGFGTTRSWNSWPKRDTERSWHTAELSACLLYTSDAADDM